MSTRSTRRALRRSGTSAAMLDEINRLRAHNSALSLFLRGAIRAYGGSIVDPRLVVARPLLEGPRDRIEAMSFEDRIVLMLVNDPGESQVDSLLDVPWGVDTAPARA